MAVKIKPVSVKVHPLFFDNLFEKKRKEYERRIGAPISQVKFTEYLARANIKFKLPPNLEKKPQLKKFNVLRRRIYLI